MGGSNRSSVTNANGAISIYPWEVQHTDGEGWLLSARRIFMLIRQYDLHASTQCGYQ